MLGDGDGMLAFLVSFQSSQPALRYYYERTIGKLQCGFLRCVVPWDGAREL